MKKILLVILIVCHATAAMASIWMRDALTGGGPGAIDAIPHSDSRPGMAGAQPLTSKDICITKFGGLIYYHVYDPASTLPESPPAVIAPDDIGNNSGRWLRVPPFLLPADIPGLAAVAVSGNYNDLKNKPTTITTQQAVDIASNTAYASSPHAPVDAEKNVNADWAAPSGGDDYIRNKPVIPTDNTQLTNGAGYLTSETNPGAEPALGNPAADGYVLSSTIAGARSWTAPAADLSTKTTTDLAEGANLYFTDARVAANPTVAANTAARHTHANAAHLDTIDQDLGTTSSPTFAGLTINGADGDRALSLLDNTAVVPCLTGDYRIYPQNGVWKRCENGTVTDIGAGAATGDMLKSIYDANADNKIDDTAVAASIARVSDIPTDDSQLTNGAGYLTSETNPGAEPALGNPAADGYVLSSTTAGGRSWIANSGGTVDLTAPGPIGTVTPDVVHATDIVANTIITNPPPTGTTDELALREDPANGTNSVTIKAPADVMADVTWVLPDSDGGLNQVMVTDGVGNLTWADAVLDTDVGTTVQAYDADLADLADGSLSGSKVGPGINAANITTGTIPDAQIPSTIARATALPLPVAAPAASTDICTAGKWAYNANYHYVCVTADIVTARTDVSFAAAGTITSLTDTIGSSVVVGSIITVSGSAANDGVYTVSSITDANNISVAEALVDEAAGATVTVSKPTWRRSALAAW